MVDERAPRRGIHWEMVSSVVAVVVGCLALGVAAYTAQLQRKQALASMWPHLTFDESGPEYHFVAVNKGVGPAIVRYVEVRADGKPVPTWDEALRILAPDAGKHGSSFATLNDTVLTAGEVREVLTFGDEELRTGMRAARAAARLSVVICYCSIFDECWIDEPSNHSRAVGECPANGASSFKQ